MDCFGTCFTHAQTCDNVRVQSATVWTASVHASKSHVDPLAMQRLLDKPGFETVLEAMQFYRPKRMGHIGWSPAAFGNLKDDHS